MFEYDGALSDEEKTKAKSEVKLPCHLNLAQCYLKRQKYKKAIAQCDKALDIDHKNIKVYFWIGVEGVRLQLTELHIGVVAPRRGLDGDSRVRQSSC